MRHLEQTAQRHARHLSRNDVLVAVQGKRAGSSRSHLEMGAHLFLGLEAGVSLTSTMKNHMAVDMHGVHECLVFQEKAASGAEVGKRQPEQQESQRRSESPEAEVVQNVEIIVPKMSVANYASRCRSSR